MDAVPPSILVIVVDDLGWNDLGVTGSSFYETPSIDRWAADSVRFSRAYAACPVCSPTRVSLQTGVHPARLATTDYFGAAGPDRWKRNTAYLPAPYEDRLPLDQWTLAELFSPHGYATFYAGKWHLGPDGFWPEQQGYHFNRGGWTRGGPYGGKKYFSPYGNPRLPDGPDGEHLPDRLASETIEFIEAHRSQPFLAVLSFYSVHTPLIARADLRDKYQQKKKRLGLQEKWGMEGTRKVRLVQQHAVYAGMVEAMDAAVGRVLTALERLGLADNTIVMLTSDNGGLSTSEGHPTSNWPLRGGKGWIYEGGIRVPWFARGPGIVGKGRQVDRPIQSTDLAPTLLALTGLEAPQGWSPDGHSFRKSLAGVDPSRVNPLFWHYPHYGNQGGSPSSAVIDGDWKLIENLENQQLELYNLGKDPGETAVQNKQHPQQLKRLHQMLLKWRNEVGARPLTARPAQKH
ncbi:MAG: sulfatase [Planctomycetota bacterium]|nr:sulfatase [Planctomycetota bacterium]